MYSLRDLAIKHGTDKCSIEHDYIDFYTDTLPKNPRKILEIGCYKGASLRMWRDYFPEAELHTLDLFIENEPPTDIPGLVAWTGHQANYYILEQLRQQEFDLVIDDGSHNSRDQMMTFFGLFTAGMHYYIEDLQCCREDFYRQGLPVDFTADTIFRDTVWEYSYDCQSPIMLIKC